MTMELDVAKILQSKSPKLAKFAPRFMINYLRRIIHQDQVNFCLRNYSHLEPIEFVRATLEYMGISYSSEGMDKLDPNRRYIFASNHPFGGLDGLMLADEVSHHFEGVRVVVNDILMNLSPLSPLFIPVNKHGRQSSKYANMYNAAFESKLPIITFPAGLCSRRHRGQVHDVRWKPSFVKRAIASHRDIVPVFFDGELSNFFYRLSTIRTRLGIKANIEMLYLADEMFRQSGNHFSIIIGEPIAWQSLTGNASTLAKEIGKKAYNLKKDSK